MRVLSRKTGGEGLPDPEQQPEEFRGELDEGEEATLRSIGETLGGNKGSVPEPSLDPGPEFQPIFAGHADEQDDLPTARIEQVSFVRRVARRISGPHVPTLVLVILVAAIVSGGMVWWQMPVVRDAATAMATAKATEEAAKAAKSQATDVATTVARSEAQKTAAAEVKKMAPGIEKAAMTAASKEAVGQVKVSEARLRGLLDKRVADLAAKTDKSIADVRSDLGVVSTKILVIESKQDSLAKMVADLDKVNQANLAAVQRIVEGQRARAVVLLNEETMKEIRAVSSAEALRLWGLSRRERNKLVNLFKKGG